MDPTNAPKPVLPPEDPSDGSLHQPEPLARRNPEPAILRFGVFEIDLRSGELRKAGALVKIQQQPLKLLALLAGRPGEVITREELRTALWGNDTFVDFDQGLNFCVKQIRAALGDQADTPRYVETLPRRGYRFIAPIERATARTPAVEPPAASGATQEDPSLATATELRRMSWPRPVPFPSPLAPEAGRPGLPSPERRLAPRLRRAVVPIALGLLLLPAAFFWGRSTAEAPSPSFQRLTFRRGSVETARFTPDGAIVYTAAWDGEPWQVYTTAHGPADTRAVGFPKARLVGVFGTELALRIYREGKGMVLARAPLAGGPHREVLEEVLEADWAHDGSGFAVLRRVDGRTRLEFPAGQVLYEGPLLRISHLRLSPRSDAVAFFEHPVAGDDRGSVVLVDRAGRKTTLSADWASLEGLDWSPNGTEVWFTGTKVGADCALYAVARTGRERLIHRSPGRLVVHDVGADGRVLLERATIRLEIRAVPPAASAERDLSWFDLPYLADLSPDGRTLIFGESGEAGGPGYGIFLRGTDGSLPVRLGDGRPMGLSPDWKWVLSVPVRPPLHIVLLPTGAGESRVLRHEGLEGYLWAGWFPDGRRILFAANEPGRAPRLYVQDVAGGPARPLTPEGVFARCSLVTPDGRFVAASGKDGKWQLYPVDGGEPPPLPGLEPEEQPLRWGKDDRTLWVLKRGSLPLKIYRVELPAGRRELWKELRPLDPAGVADITRLILTPDGSSYAYGYLRTLSELYLVSGLR